MAERDIPNNSLTAKPNPVPEKHIEKITKKKVTVRKVSPGKKFIRRFLAEDVDDIGDYLVNDLIIPEIKDITLNFLNALLWGDKRTGRINRGGSGTYTPYSSASHSAYVRTNSLPRNRSDDRQPRQGQKKDLDSIILESRAEAEDVLNRMDELIATYHQVTVADLYELVGISGEYTDNYYGWTDIGDAGIRRASGGFMLDLPRPVYLR